MLGNWVKFPTEILINRHYGNLSPIQWQLAAQLRLIKGMKPENSILPPIEDIHWATRTFEDINDLKRSIDELYDRGILDRDGQHLLYPNLVEEGEYDSAKVRKARQRAKDRLLRTSHLPVTIRDPEREEVERSEQDKTRAEEDAESVSAASADLVGDLAKSLTASLDGGSPDIPDDAFWERQKSLRLDLHMEKVREKLETYCRKNRKKLTREYAEAWVKREKTPLEEITPIKPNKPKVDVAFEEEAFKWRAEHYPDTLDPARHPTWKTFPFKNWPTETQKEFLGRHNQTQ